MTIRTIIKTMIWMIVIIRITGSRYLWDRGSIGFALPGGLIQGPLLCSKYKFWEQNMKWKTRTYQHWPIPKRSEQKCPGASSMSVKNPGASRGLIIAQPPAWAPQQLPWAARGSEKGSTGAPWSTNVSCISCRISWFIFKRHDKTHWSPLEWSAKPQLALLPYLASTQIVTWNRNWDETLTKLWAKEAIYFRGR